MKMKSLQIEEDIHEMLMDKNKEFKQKNNYELPLGIIAGKVIRKHINETDL